VYQFVSHADFAAIVEKEWRLNYVQQNNAVRTSVRQYQTDDYRNQLLRLRYSIPPQLIRAVHCVLEYTQQRMLLSWQRYRKLLPHLTVTNIK